MYDQKLTQRRNGSPSDSRSEDCVFDSSRVQFPLILKKNSIPDFKANGHEILINKTISI